MREEGITGARQRITYSFDRRTRSPLRRICLPPGLLSGLGIGSLLCGLDGVVTASPAAPSSPFLFEEEVSSAEDAAKFFLRGIWKSSMIVVGFENKWVLLFVGDFQFKCNVIGCGTNTSLDIYAMVCALSRERS